MTSVSRREDAVLVADDESYNLQFLLDFLESLKLKVDIVSNVDCAILRLQKARYRLVLADLSIPLLPPQALLIDRDPMYKKYPGLLIVDYARNHGHTGRQVVVYSVHDDPQVRDLAAKYGVTYILKGRPRSLKDEIRDILAFDPLAKPKG